MDRGGTARRVWGRILATLPLAALLLAATLVSAAPARADSGLEVSSTSRYTVDLARQSVAASMTITLGNSVPDEGIRYFYFDAYALPLPAAAADVQALSEGTSLPVRTSAIDGEPGYLAFEIAFPPLHYRQTRTIELTFTLTGQPPRADDPTRIGPTHATFPVFGPGDPGHNTVEVVVPVGAVVDSTVASFERRSGGDGATEVYATSEDNLSPGLSATMAVTAPGSSEGVDVTVGGIPLTLRPYPNDAEWATFVETWADRGLPVLRDLLGTDWPGEIDAIREDSGSRVRGFDGWYSTSQREIVLGENLDAGLLFHELSHAWFNASTIEDRWLYEGLAEFAAEHTAGQTGADFVLPASVGQDEEPAVPLAEWTSSPGFRGTPTDVWAYPASYAVVSELLDGLTAESLRGVLEDTVTATSPWDLDGQRTLSGGRLTTRTFLDILDHHEAPATLDGSAGELYRAWVMGAEQIPLLDQRDDALARYDAFVALGPWGAPLGLRRAMSTWDYDLALEITRDRRQLPERAGHLVDLADRVGVALDPEVQKAYEAADHAPDYEVVAHTVETVTHAIEQYAQARRVAEADHGPVTDLGARVLRVDDASAAARDRLDSGDYEGSVMASRATVERVDRATAVGAVLLGGAVFVVVALLGTVLLIRWWRRARSGQPAATTAPDLSVPR